MALPQIHIDFWLYFWILLLNWCVCECVACICCMHSVVKRAKIQVLLLLFVVCVEIVKLYSVHYVLLLLKPFNIFSANVFFYYYYYSSWFAIECVLQKMKKMHIFKHTDTCTQFAIEKQVFIDGATASSPPEIGNLILRNWWQCIKIQHSCAQIERISFVYVWAQNFSSYVNSVL